MKYFKKHILLILSIALFSSCEEKIDEQKYQKLEALRNSLTEHYDKLELQNTLSNQYDSMKVVLDSMYAQKDKYRAKMDTAIADFERLKKDAKRLKHDYFPTNINDIADDMKELRKVLEDGMQWITDENDSLQ